MNRKSATHWVAVVVSCLIQIGVGTTSVMAGSSGEVRETPLAQNTELLQDQNGEIVEVENQPMSSRWSDSCECYRIVYLSDGLRVVGYAMKPKRDGKYPAIIFNRGGNRDYGKIEGSNLWYWAFLCSEGYVVLGSQYRGNDGGDGQEQFGGDDVNDVLNLIAAAKSLAIVDPEEIMMLGMSRGGMMSYIAIKRGADIRAAAIVGGISDLERLYEDREAAMKQVITDLAGTDRNEWRKRSAVHWADQLDVPILLLHGTSDERVSVYHAEKMDELLSAAGKEHKTVLCAGGDHLLNNYQDTRNREIFEWFASHLY